MTKIFTLLIIQLLAIISIGFSQNNRSTTDNHSSAPNRSIVDNGINGIKVFYSFNKTNYFEREHNNEVFAIQSITDFSFLQEVGKPALPSHIDLIAIPDGAEYELRINNDVAMVENTKRIFPALQPARDTEGAAEPKFEINKEFYNTNQIYPQQSVRIIGEMEYRGIRMAMVEICPIQYNPVTSKIYSHSDVGYELIFSGANTFTNYSKHTKNYINQVLNYPLNNKSFTEEADAYYANNTQAKTSTSKNYIIITHSNFSSAADSLANWKRKMGYSVEVISANNWTSTSVKNAVHTRYQNWTPKPDYLLIIGDNADVPSEINYINGDAYGTDLYYVCMDGSNDFVPDMAKGRISPSNASNAMMQVMKIINYERSPISDTSFYQNGMNCAQFQDDDNNGYADRRFLHTSENIRDYVMSKGYNSQRVYYTDNTVIPTNYNNGYYSQGQALPSVLLKSNGFNWNNGSNAISSSINSGKFFVFHRDHGYAGGYGWAHPYFTNNSMSQLNNGDKLPVVFSINCHTGEFTLPSCFAETFMRKTNGGSVGIFAASYYSYSGYNDGFSAGLIDGIWSNPGLIPSFGSGGIYNPSTTPHNDIRTMGDLLNHALTRVIQTWGGSGSGNRYTHELFHYFGDPAMRIWTQLPDTIIASIGDSISCSATGFAINNCNVLDATATISKDGLLIGKTTLTNGNGIIPISSLPGQSFTITLSASNYKPLKKKIVLGSGTNLGLYKENSNNTCFGINEASIEVFPACGTPPYDVQWSNGDTTFFISNLADGIYTVIVNDNANNTVYDTIEITGPSTALQVISTVNNTQCYFQSNGSIQLNTTGGIAPYTYLWSTGGTDSDLNNLAAGQYNVEVIDSLGCIKTDSFTISQPLPLDMTTNIRNDSTGSCAGIATAVATGGTSPYTYLWNDPANQTTATATGLCPSLYKVILTDNNNCTTQKSLYIINTLSINNPNLRELISISPNPSNTGVFNLKIEKELRATIEYSVYNSLGEILMTRHSATDNSDIQEIDISKYAQGIYYLHLSTENSTIVYKLIYSY